MFRFLSLLIFLYLGSILLHSAAAVREPAGHQDLKLKPIYVTARIFQLRTARGSSAEVTDQVFKMPTASLSDHTKWISALGKVYPGEAALLRTETRRVFRTANQAVFTVARHADGRTLEVRVNAAHSLGDGDRPGTSLIPEFGLHFGLKMGGKPLSYSTQSIEIEHGQTYFYAVPDLKLTPADYVNFFRPTVPTAAFSGDEIRLILAYSVELDKTTAPARALDERQSLDLQRQATRTVQPEIPTKLAAAGLGGVIRVQIEISAAGRVTGTQIQYSTFPEINGQALAAARQWEFPTTLFAENKNPITGSIVFDLAARAPAAPGPQVH
ncbi:MAG TPA: TonB family protein [Blastocatellia bacterium]|nr:TonB family protein [Blastocatellia bacterium]